MITATIDGHTADDDEMENFEIYHGDGDDGDGDLPWCGKECRLYLQ